MAIRMLRRPAVQEVTGLKRDSLYGLIREGRFPPPRKISKRASAWRSDEIEAWIESLPTADELDENCNAPRIAARKAANELDQAALSAPRKIRKHASTGRPTNAAKDGGE